MVAVDGRKVSLEGGYIENMDQRVFIFDEDLPEMAVTSEACIEEG